MDVNEYVLRVLSQDNKQDENAYSLCMSNILCYNSDDFTAHFVMRYTGGNNLPNTPEQ